VITSFGDQAVADIRKVVRQVLNEPRNRTQRSIPANIKSVPTHYALTPSGGIPAFSSPTLGEAECSIYDEEEQTNGTVNLTTWTLPDATTKSATVYNPGSSAVAGDSYVPIWQTKRGRWMAYSPGQYANVWTCGGGANNTNVSTSDVLVNLTTSSIRSSVSDTDWSVDTSSDKFTCAKAGYWSMVNGLNIRNASADLTMQVSTYIYNSDDSLYRQSGIGYAVIKSGDSRGVWDPSPFHDVDVGQYMTMYATCITSGETFDVFGYNVKLTYEGPL